LLSKVLIAGAALALVASAGPVEFGMAEFEQALAARGLAPRAVRLTTEVSADPPETYRIASGLVTGGDLRGVMYGLLDAAEQVRASGRVRASHGAPAFAIRGVRVRFEDFDGDPDSFHSRGDWLSLLRTLARNRFNRFNLVVTDLSRFLAPLPDPLPATPAVEERNLGTLQFLSQAATDYGMEFTLGVWAPPGGAAGWDAALARILAACPAIRSVQLRMDTDAAMRAVRTVRNAGRRITLDVAAGARAVAGAARGTRLPLRISAPYPGELPAAGGAQSYWELPARAVQGGHTAVRPLLNKLAGTGAAGFEIQMPAAERAAAIAMDRHQRPGAGFFLLGRFGYDSKALADSR
jgi:hypothetical protein